MAGIRKRAAVLSTMLLAWLSVGWASSVSAAPTLDWTVTYSRTYGGSQSSLASHTAASGNTYFIFESGFFDVRLLIYDPNGAVLRNVLLDVADAYVTAMTVDSFGGIVAAGTRWNVVSATREVAVARYSAAGGLSWAMTYDTGFDAEVYDVATDSSGDVWVAGAHAFSAPGSYDALIVKYDSAGAWQWAQQWDFMGNNDYGYAVAADGLGNAYVAGVASDTLSAPYPFLAKYDPSGALLYSSVYTSQMGYEVRALTAGAKAVYLAADDSTNIRVLRANAVDGTIGASGTYFGSPSASNVAGGIAVSGVGTVYVSGTTSDIFAVPPNDNLLLLRFDSSLATNFLMDTYDHGGQDGYGFPSASTKVGMDGAGDIYLSAPVNPSFCFGAPDLFVRKYGGGGAPLWTRIVDGPPMEWVIGAVADGSGNVYVGGNSGWSNPKLRKFDSNGNLQWEQSALASGICAWGAEGLALGGGSVYLSMTAQNPVTFTSEAKILEFDDVTGTLVGTRVFDLIPDTYGGPITLDASGNLYLAASFNSSTTFESELLVAKFDPAGTIQWSRTMTFSMSDTPTGIALDGFGGLYVCEPYGFGSQNEYGLIKLDSASGNVLWTKSFTPNPSLDCFPNDLKAVGANIFLVGEEEDWGTGDLWGRIYRLDTAGNVVWTRTYDGGGQDAVFNKVAIDPSGFVVVTGAVGSAFFNVADILTLAYTAGGARLWSMSYDSGGPTDWGMGVAIGSVYVAGTSGTAGRLLKYTEIPAALSASLTLAPSGSVLPGQVITATLTVNNTGQGDANVKVDYMEVESDPLLLGPAVPPSPAGPFLLAGGATRSMTWNYVVGACGAGSINAQVTGSEKGTGKPLGPIVVTQPVTIAGNPASLVMSSRDSKAQVGDLVELIVEVFDDCALPAPVAGASVTWSVQTGGGVVYPATGVTDAAGKMVSQVSLGAQPGINVIRVDVSSGGVNLTGSVSVEGTPLIAPKPSLSSNFFDPTKGDRLSVRTLVPTSVPTVRIHIYNMAGELIRAVGNVPVQSGLAEWKWDGKNAKGELVGNGVYFIQIESGKNVQIRRVIVLKQ